MGRPERGRPGGPPAGTLIYGLAERLAAAHPWWVFARERGRPWSPAPGDALLVDCRDGQGYRRAGPVLEAFVARELDTPARRKWWSLEVAVALAALIEATTDRRAGRRRQLGPPPPVGGGLRAAPAGPPGPWAGVDAGALSLVRLARASVASGAP